MRSHFDCRPIIHAAVGDFHRCPGREDAGTGRLHGNPGGFAYRGGELCFGAQTSPYSSAVAGLRVSIFHGFRR